MAMLYFHRAAAAAADDDDYHDGDDDDHVDHDFNINCNHDNDADDNYHKKLYFRVLAQLQHIQACAVGHTIDQFHKSQNAPVPYPTMLLSEQKCAHVCSEQSIMGYGTGVFWDLWIRSITRSP